VESLTVKLLQLLERDATLSAARLATMLGADEESIARRIGDLEQSGVIVRRKAVVNWSRVGVEPVIALIEVRVSPQREVGFGSLAARISRFPEARSVYLVSGTYDLAVEVIGQTMKDIAAFVQEKLAPLDGVQGTTTHFLLQRYKADGDMFDSPEGSSRLPFAP